MKKNKPRWIRTIKKDYFLILQRNRNPNRFMRVALRIISLSNLQCPCDRIEKTAVKVD